MSTGLGLGGEWETDRECHCEGSLLFSVFQIPPQWSAGRGGVGWHGGRQVGVQGEAPGGHASASSSRLFGSTRQVS